MLFIGATLIPIWKYQMWWVRIFDFPRAQIALGGFVVLIAYAGLVRPTSSPEVALLIVLLLCVLFQCYKMLPYTPLFPKQVKAATTEDHSCGRLSVLLANVLMENRAADRFLSLIDEYDPDVVLTVETDSWWVDRLSCLDGSYPYAVKIPLPNTYGMMLQSRLEIVDSEVKYLLDASIPSIHARIEMAEGPIVRLFCVHPRPPAPAEDTDTVERDAEILVVGRAAREEETPSIVMGDLNDVAWSHTTSLFQRVSGLLDPRIGRGLFTTFHAGNPLLRWPLDHLFHSNHFKLVRMDRLPSWGSDHFPVFVRLQYSARAAEHQDRPQADAADRSESREKIELADEA
jgi:endonuclease/exonuclease/phosphatase (EEP) superfamily protein YafD